MTIFTLGGGISRFSHYVRPGYRRRYRSVRKDIAAYDSYTTGRKKEYIFDKVFPLVKYAAGNIPFYKKFYADCGFSIGQLKDFDDIKLIPIVNKAILNGYPLEERSSSSAGSRFLMNTGGTSGDPLTFYVGREFMAREYSHMHYIWESHGYKRGDMRLILTGRSNLRDGVKYDPLRNILLLDIYSPFLNNAGILKETLSKTGKSKIFLHGYPSALDEFASYCSTDEELKTVLSAKLGSVFYCSEYPFPHIRENIENTFGVKGLSWFGHSEACILAYEKDADFVYAPLQTYGFTESIPNADGTSRLIGTSYDRYCCPLIRYDSEDVVDNLIEKDGLLESFMMADGQREGCYVFDKSGNKISVIGLTRGRHHPLFKYVSHMQLKQTVRGEVTVYYVRLPDTDFRFNADMFNSSDLDMDIKFMEVMRPIRSKNGKVSWLIKDEESI